MAAILYDLLNENPSIKIEISLANLIEAIDYSVKSTRKELEQQITDANTETYPSPEQVTKILNVDMSTLWRWQQKGYLVPIKVGGKRRYKMSDIKQILSEK